MVYNIYIFFLFTMSQFVVVTSAYVGDNDIRSKIKSIVKKVKNQFKKRNKDIDCLEYCESHEVPDNIIVGDGLLKESVNIENKNSTIQSAREFDGITISRTPLIFVGDGYDISHFRLICTELSSSESTNLKLVCLTTYYHTVDSIPYYMFIRDRIPADISLYDQYVTERDDIICLLPLFFIPRTASPCIDFDFLSSSQNNNSKITEYNIEVLRRKDRQKILDELPEDQLMRCGKVSMKSGKRNPNLNINIASWNRTGITHAITVDNGNIGWSHLNDWIKRVNKILKGSKLDCDELETIPNHVTIAVIYIPEELIDVVENDKEDIVSDLIKRLKTPYDYQYILRENKDSLEDFGPVLALPLAYNKPPEQNFKTQNIRDITLDILKKRYGKLGLKLADERNNPHITIFRSSDYSKKYVISRAWELIDKNITMFEFNTIKLVTINRRGVDTVLFSCPLK